MSVPPEVQMSQLIPPRITGEFQEDWTPSLMTQGLLRHRLLQDVPRGSHLKSSVLKEGGWSRLGRGGGYGSSRETIFV